MAFTAIVRISDSAVDVHNSMLLMLWFLLIVMWSAPRFAYRMWRRRTRHAKAASPQVERKVPVLLIGTGEGSKLFIDAVSAEPQAPYRVLGLLSLDGGDLGRFLGDVPVLGRIDESEQIFARFRRAASLPSRIIVTEAADGSQLRHLVGVAEPLGIPVSRLPSLVTFREAIDDGRIELRPVALSELLGRPQADLNFDAMDRLIAGRDIIVTGAGGSIGSELVRQIALRRPSLLVLLDHCEFNLYRADLDLQGEFPDLPRQAILCDVRDAERIDAIFRRVRPSLVFHAAALKHVPMVELNPTEGILTNVLGTRNVAEAARAHGAVAMVLISSDKAVNPTSVMGASKRLAEFYAQALDLAGSPMRPGGTSTRVLTVRFGNVLGSSGSVIPLFQRQLAHRGPLTVTHPEIKRYFMTVKEATQLVLHATALGLRQPDRRGTIYVLDMGEPIKVMDIARQMIRLAGLEPEVDVPIEIVGLRPGEKLYEELFDDTERRVDSSIDGVLAAVCQSIDEQVLDQVFADLVAACRRHDTDGLKPIIQRLIPAFPHGQRVPAFPASTLGDVTTAATELV
ncbi:polysaccharide biosynthesis protein [Marinivivus vitaminiproducens]|uniref:polysaccharide biosynthesis protein n=1 Tax=Marinivivus vitaminiproducens TaxID=3035935 RepID=UPI0027A19F76|nr:nucleoside-diphosphate sugar epimerase/dehydratase [Geminicoccaceae bacterium SCSIO 64248]